MERVVDGSYRCFLPQEAVRGGGVGDMVVFSVKISRNSESDKTLLPDAFARVEDSCVTVRMSCSPSDFQDLRGDREGLRSRERDRRERLQTLVYNCLAGGGSKRIRDADFSVRVLGGGGGGGSGGPTGIAVAVVSRGFGGQLAYEVGRAVEAGVQLGQGPGPRLGPPPKMNEKTS